jgi:iron(III) transport system permease protein
LLAAGTVIALVLLAPLVFLVVEASQAGWHEVSRLLLRHLTATLLWNTIRLTVVVTVGCAVIGTAAAFVVERTEVPFRRMWAVAVVIPLAIPDFVVAYAWVAAVPSLHGLWGAAVVMTLALYPLVYLPVAAVLRRSDPGLEEAARSLGLGRVETFRRVTLRQVRPAVLGGCLVVALALLAEYGAFEILRFQTFTTTIFTELDVAFDSPAACALALVLVALGLVVLVGEAALNRRSQKARAARPSGQRPSRIALGRATLPALAGLTVLVLLALGFPVGTIVYWLTHSRATTLPGTPVVSAVWHSAGYAAAAGVVATIAAVPIALLAVRHPTRASLVIERSTYVVQSLPGVVVALSLVFFAIHYALRAYQSPQLLIGAYAILFFPLAVVCVIASVAQAPGRLQDIGRSLGVGRIAVFARVTLPLIAPGLAASFCLVFLSAVTELTATLKLIPTGQQTLATQFWAYERNASYGAAAPYAAMLIGIAVVPSYVIARWFDRRTQAGVAATGGGPIVNAA